MAGRILYLSIVFCAAAAIGSLSVPHLAKAQDGSATFDDFMAEIEAGKKDQALCRNDEEDVAPEDQVSACTRLIEDAPYENDLVGTYYINRAMAGSDPDQSCADASKGVQVLQDSNSSIYGEDYLDAARRLEESLCR